MKYRFVAFQLFVFICLFSNGVFADSWKIYNEGSGLPGDKVLSFAVAKDRMVVGTNRGMAIFHGDDCRWRKVPMPVDFEDAEVRDVAFDQNNNLWAATQKGLIFLAGAKSEVFSTKDGLPNCDLERVQIRENQIFVGCFGGLVVRASVPVNGRTSFLAVNFDGNATEDVKKIRSVGISGLGMKDLNQGWISTKGGGLQEIRGGQTVAFDCNQDLASDWVEGMWIFSDMPNSEKIIAATSVGLSLIENGRILDKSAFPKEEAWLSSVITLKKKQDEDKIRFSDPKSAALAEFIGARSLWVGTRDQGLWRFEDGKWTQFTTENSALPTMAINRLFRVGGRLVVCTNAGLVIISLGGQAYDEYLKTGFGSRNFKTFFPHPRVQAIRKIVLGKDLWVSHTAGLSRFVKSSGIYRDMVVKTPDYSGSIETPAETDQDSDTPGKTAPVMLGGEKLWYVFDRENGDIFSNNIYDMTLDASGNLWIIFDKKVLCRLRMVECPSAAKSDQLVEKPFWEFFGDIPNLGTLGDKKTNQSKVSDQDDARREVIEKFYVRPEKGMYKSGADSGFAQPWSDNAELSCVWFDKTLNRILVGTKKEGIYALNNSNSMIDDGRKEPFDWLHIGENNALPPIEIIGFDYFAPLGEEKQLVVLGLNELLIFNGKVFSEIPLAGRRDYYCLQADGTGNLLIGGDGGLFKLKPDKSFVSYTKTNASLQSDRITGISISPSEGAAMDYWIGCNETNCFDKFYYKKVDPKAKDTKSDKKGEGDSTKSGNSTKAADSTKESNSTKDADSAKNCAAAAVINELGPGQWIDYPMFPVETDIDGGSLNFFDGITWDCWKVPGISCLLSDGDYLWVGTSTRIRRFYVKVF
ncbi:MAG: hypothetical protein WA705_14730 [Candidatus Ozemobacteraceae bacterium]